MLNALKGNVPTAQSAVPAWVKPPQQAGAGQGTANPAGAPGTPFLSHPVTPPTVDTHPAAAYDGQVPHLGSGSLQPAIGYASSMSDWVHARPQMTPGGDRNAYQAAIGQWAAAQPAPPDFGRALNGGSSPGPVMTPGGGNGSVPGTPGGPPLPPSGVGMVPGVPGSMGTNPGIVPPWLQGGANTQFPTNQGYGSSYGVIGATPPPTPFQLPGY